MVTIAQSVGKFFFPHRKILKLFKENYSPDLLRKITYAGVHSTTSFEEAQENLKVLAEVLVSTSHIQRLTNRIGNEFSKQDIESSDFLEEVSEQNDIQIEVASVSVDGGRAQIRKEDCGAGVHNPAWLETKVGCLQVLQSEENEEDPHPKLPRIFKNKKAVKHMVEGLKRKGKQNKQEDEKESEESKSDSKRQAEEIKSDTTYGPKVVKKFVTATIDKAEPFGKLIFNKANQQQLHTAKRKAYLADGDRKIWTIYEDNFRPDGWVPILDFVHAVEYAFEAAKLSTENENQCWGRYIEFIIHIWQGRVLTVLRKLDKIIEVFRHFRKSKLIQEKIERLEDIRGYFQNNYNKMNYPEYRMKGLPVSSCHVESLIKQINIRVKSTEKFWNKSVLKGILKIKSSLLSNDNSWQHFWDYRYDRQVNSKRNYLRRAA